MEILAPAGSNEGLVAAVRCGADAVYMGTKDFNARRNALNFDETDLAEAVTYCHNRGVKVYVTLNTLVSNDELSLFYKTVDKAMSAGADAFIVQDIGAAQIMRSCFPTARLHASTQCSAVTPDGFRALEELGFCRAVVPREMSKDEIREVRSATDMELEAFVHGALCMCVSGQCYMSSVLGSRSGNRGLCAQPCRLNFSAKKDKNDHALSLKDLSLIGHIDTLSRCGITSLKIEGRMKRPEYVAAAVTACRKALRGEYTEDDEKMLKSVFSRSGFTDSYLTGMRENMFGVRKKEDVTAAGGVLGDLRKLYQKEVQSVALEMSFSCRFGQAAHLTAKAEGKTAEVDGTTPQAALTTPLTKESLTARLSKLGGTQYFATKVKIDIDSGLMLPASEINRMRRKAVEILDSPQKAQYVRLPMPQTEKKNPSYRHYYTASFLNPETIPKNNPFRRIFIPIGSSDEYFYAENCGVMLPRGAFSNEGKIKKRLEHLREKGVTYALANDIGMLKTARDIGFDVCGGWGLNVFNTPAAEKIKSPILSFELSCRQAGLVAAKDTGIIGYGRLPLMLCRNCPVKNAVGCKKCGSKGVLTDRKGYRFPVACSGGSCVEILNSLPLYMGDRIDEINTDFVHFIFTDEDSRRVKQVVSMFESGEPFDQEFTRGLYLRGVK